MNGRLQLSHSGDFQGFRDVRVLTRSIRRGDEAAFEEFYERYCDRIYRLLLSLARGDDLTAREILQTVMIKAARQLPLIEREGELWSWLARVARNALVDYVRHHARRHQVSHWNAELSESAIEMPVDDSTLNWLEDAVKELPSEDRRLINECYANQRTHREMASMLGRSPKAIESKLARIRAELRRILHKRIRDEKA